MSAVDFLPKRHSLSALAKAAARCRRCDLYKRATQTVFGEGPARSSLMLVGETPGDREDMVGRPFVGPAGRLLDEVLEEVGLDRERIYVTNAVKHFKWEPRGKRRLHKKPSAREQSACRPWLDAEIETVAPRGVVCLGASAAQALLGRQFRITRQRGELLDSQWSNWLMATWHPSAVLRAREHDDRVRMRGELVDDFRRAVEALNDHA
jgi:DNA polymerase